MAKNSTSFPNYHQQPHPPKGKSNESKQKNTRIFSTKLEMERDEKGEDYPTEWWNEHKPQHTTLFPLKATLHSGVGLWNNHFSPEVSSFFPSTPTYPPNSTCKRTISFAFLCQVGYSKWTPWPCAGEEAADQTGQTFGPSTTSQNIAWDTQYAFWNKPFWNIFEK